MLRELLYGAAWWLGFLPLYLLLAGSLDWQEMVAGAGLSVLAALAVTVTHRAGKLHFQPRLRWLKHFRRLPGKVLADCGIVGAALLRREKSTGIFRTIPFAPGGEDAESAARRALVVAGASLAPNTYVVAIDTERGQLVLHQLVPTAQPPGGGDQEWPL